MSNYFSDQIAQGKQIIPPSAEQAPGIITGSTAQVAASVETDWNGLPVRAVGDRVFILKQGKKHWVTSPEAMAKLGFKLGDEVKLDQASLDLFPDGDPIRV